MSNGGAVAVVAAAAAAAEAIKASGAIVHVPPEDFVSLVNKVDKPLVVVSESTFLGKTYRYLSGYKGLILYAKSKTPLQIRSDAELIVANRIWIPG